MKLRKEGSRHMALMLFCLRRLSAFSAGLWSVIFLVDYESS